MVGTRKRFIASTIFLSGGAALLSIVSLATQQWVTSPVINLTGAGPGTERDSIKFGLFGGLFRQTSAFDATTELTMVCLFDKNVCALLCGNNMKTNLRKLYYNQEVSLEDVNQCAAVLRDKTVFNTYDGIFQKGIVDFGEDKVFINAGVWVSTIFFLCLSIVSGLIASGLAVWNTFGTPPQAYFKSIGMYIYNTVAVCSITVAAIVWGVMFSTVLHRNIPTYKTFLEKFTTKDYAFLGFSYWINLAALVLYLISIGVLYMRDYFISKDPKVNESTRYSQVRVIK